MSWTRHCDSLHCETPDERWIKVVVRPAQGWHPTWTGIEGTNAIRYDPLPGGVSRWTVPISPLTVVLDACSLQCLADILRDCPQDATVADIKGYEFPVHVIGGCASVLAADLVSSSGE